MFISVSSIFFTIIYVAIAFGIVLVKFELNFTSSVPLASGICSMHSRMFLFKTLLCFSLVFLKLAPQIYLAVFVCYLLSKIAMVRFIEKISS